MRRVRLTQQAHVRAAHRGHAGKHSEGRQNRVAQYPIVHPIDSVHELRPEAQVEYCVGHKRSQVAAGGEHDSTDLARVRVIQKEGGHCPRYEEAGDDQHHESHSAAGAPVDPSLHASKVVALAKH